VDVVLSGDQGIFREGEMHAPEYRRSSRLDEGAPQPTVTGRSPFPYTLLLLDQNCDCIAAVPVKSGVSGLMPAGAVASI